MGRSRATADKAELRTRFRAIRAAIPPAEMAAAAEAAARRVGALLAETPAVRTVALYFALPGEFPAAPAIAACRASGRRVCLPAWARAEKTYRFALYEDGAPTAPGPLRIPQPVGAPFVDICEIDLFLVPGLAFDRAGGRLGYGGGWYDRLLAQARPGALRYGLCHPAQISPKPLPMEAHDVPVVPLLARGF